MIRLMESKQEAAEGRRGGTGGGAAGQGEAWQDRGRRGGTMSGLGEGATRRCRFPLQSTMSQR